MYKKHFFLTGRKGNNAFSYDLRAKLCGAEPGAEPRLYVPAVIDGCLGDVQVGGEVVFEDVDEHGELQSCKGLKNFVRIDLGGVPAVVMDNHNHAFYFWHEALERGLIERGATLIHVDQHKDMREPEEGFGGWGSGGGLDEVFRYTNEVLNVGNYLSPAMTSGLIGEVQFVTGESNLEDTSFVGRGNKILNLDLDFFAEEMGYIDFEKAKRFILAHLGGCDFVTIATSPFFIEQKRAMKMLKGLTGVGS